MSEMIELKESETIEETPVTEESLREQGVDETQIKMAKEHGIIKEPEDGEHEEPPITEDETSSTVEEQAEETEESSEEEVVDVDSLDFDAVHSMFESDPSKFRDLPPAIKKLYHNGKGLYKRAKTEEQAKKDLEKELEFIKLQEKGANSILEKVNSLPEDPDSLTLEALQAVVGGDKKEVEKYVTKEELAEAKKNEEQQLKESQFVADRFTEIDKLGSTEFENYNELVDLAKEVFATEDGRDYQEVLEKAVLDPNVSEERY